MYSTPKVFIVLLHTCLFIYSCVIVKFGLDTKLSASRVGLSIQDHTTTAMMLNYWNSPDSHCVSANVERS